MARHAAALRVAKEIAKRFLHPGLKIAVYVAFDGEMETASLAWRARQAGCRIFAPVVVDVPRRHMEFVDTARITTGRQNKFGILEPRDTPSRRIAPRRLDIILLPLLAFDAQGWRLGFGGGYYDRKLAFKRRTSQRKPLLIGVGYEFQRVSTVAPSRWDVKLDYIATERGVRRCRGTPYSFV